MDWSLFHSLNGALRHDDGGQDDAQIFNAWAIFALVGLAGAIYGSSRARRARSAPSSRPVSAAASAALALLLNVALGELWFHNRPFVDHPRATLLLVPHAADNSFPSDHASVAFAVAFAVLAFHRKLGLVLLLGAAAIAIDRVFVGVHYPVDVTASVFVGLGSALVVTTVGRSYVSWGVRQLSRLLRSRRSRSPRTYRPDPTISRRPDSRSAPRRSERRLAVLSGRPARVQALMPPRRLQTSWPARSSVRAAAALRWPLWQTVTIVLPLGSWCMRLASCVSGMWTAPWMWPRLPFGVLADVDDEPRSALRSVRLRRRRRSVGVRVKRPTVQARVARSTTAASRRRTSAATGASSSLSDDREHALGVDRGHVRLRRRAGRRRRCRAAACRGRARSRAPGGRAAGCRRRGSGRARARRRASPCSVACTSISQRTAEPFRLELLADAFGRLGERAESVVALSV